MKKKSLLIVSGLLLGSFGTRGFYQSPYPPHQIYDLRGIPHGGLVEDRVGGGYFRKP